MVFKMKKTWLWLIGLLSLALLILAIALFLPVHENARVKQPPFDKKTMKTSAAPAKKSDPVQSSNRGESAAPANSVSIPVQKTSATLAAVGDVLIHDRVYNAARTKSGYDFKPMFRAVKPIIKSADIAVANSESIIGGSQIGLSTYPCFNSPYEVADAMKDAGFDVVTMANNHTLDRGVTAIENAIHYWDKIGMVHTGSFLSKRDRDTIRIVSRNGVTFAFLAYTYGTNGIPTPKNQDYLVNRIDLPLIQKDVQQARRLSDVVVVCLHFGTEYQREPNAEQKALVRKLADAGVDVILGSHPHVLQPYEWVTGKTGHRTFVIYSLGNFLSGQKGLYNQIGGILLLKIVKTDDGVKPKIVIEQPRFIPTWVQPKTYRVIPLTEAGRYGLGQAQAVYKETLKHVTVEAAH